MRGGNYSFGRRICLSLAMTTALATAFSGTTSAWPAQPSASGLNIELNGTSDSLKASESLSNRLGEVTQLLAKLSQTNRIKPEESSSFATQIDSFKVKLDKTGSSSMASLVDLAGELDSLMLRIAKTANLVSFPGLIAVDTFGQTRQVVETAQQDEEQFDILCLKPAELRSLLDDRRLGLSTATSKEGSDSPRADLRLSNELSRLEQLRSGLASVKNEQLVIPVAVEHDLLGNRIIGVVRSYELRPMVDADQSATPTASTSTLSEDLSDQISQIETRLQREVLTERITSDEAQRVGEGLKTIVALEKDYRSDGHLTDAELARLSSALFRLNSRLSRSVALK